ncbi:MAG: hypothetical protein WCI87_07695 [Euryarchaeota archaeon]
MKTSEIKQGKPIWKALKTDVHDDGNLAITATVATESPDRVGDVIRIDGLNTKNYGLNNIITWAHKYDEPSIGRATKLWKVTENGVKKLKAHIEFVPDSVYDKNYAGIKGSQIYRMYQSGFLNAFSVGFAPLEWSPLNEKRFGAGVDYTYSELLEIACTPVPANAEALADKSNAEYRTLLKSWAKDTLRRCVDCETVYEVDTTVLIEELREYAEAIGRVVPAEIAKAINREDKEEEYYLVDLAELKRDIDATVAQVVQEAV